MVGLAALDPPYNCPQPFPQQELLWSSLVNGVSTSRPAKKIFFSTLMARDPRRLAIAARQRTAARSSLVCGAFSLVARAGDRPLESHGCATDHGAVGAAAGGPRAKHPAQRAAPMFADLDDRAARVLSGRARQRWTRRRTAAEVVAASSSWLAQMLARSHVIISAAGGAKPSTAAIGGARGRRTSSPFRHSRQAPRGAPWTTSTGAVRVAAARMAIFNAPTIDRAILVHRSSVDDARHGAR